MESVIRKKRWTCPMCGKRTTLSPHILENRSKICPRCFDRTRKRRTMSWSEFQRLCVVNSPKVPVAEIGGRRKKWVGIGLFDEGPATGKEVLITP